MDLFNTVEESKKKKKIPLATRMCPGNLDEFVGQKHLLGEGKLLVRAIKADRVSSLILYGPPGSGKTALAQVIANLTKSKFERLNAVLSNVGEMRRIIEQARHRLFTTGQSTILFIDEIHRFNKAQQDVLLPHVEDGTVTLIGTTTHNPFFSVNSPLLSRSQIFQLSPLTEDEILILLERALADKERGLGSLRLTVEKDALKHMARMADGDARKALNALEIGALTTESDEKEVVTITLKVAEDSIQKKSVVYDDDGDAHYDTISAFIKSLRGSDPDAALYWLATMLNAGEDPLYIARRLVICAAEDVGNADPMALVVANSAMQVTEFVGLPEAKIPLAQATVYIATAHKSNASYMGIEKALKDVETQRSMEVPVHLKDTHYRGAEKLGHGVDYKYPHEYKGHWIQQEYVPQKKKYYRPSGLGYEKTIKERLKNGER